MTRKQLLRKRIGTSFKGCIYAQYEQLVGVFGDALIPDELNSKTDVEWIIKTPYGIATIYNYKDGKRYLGENGMDYTKICEWHSGAKNSDSYIWVKEKLEQSLLSSL